MIYVSQFSACAVRCLSAFVRAIFEEFFASVLAEPDCLWRFLTAQKHKEQIHLYLEKLFFNYMNFNSIYEKLHRLYHSEFVFQSKEILGLSNGNFCQYSNYFVHKQLGSRLLSRLSVNGITLPPVSRRGRWFLNTSRCFTCSSIMQKSATK